MFAFLNGHALVGYQRASFNFFCGESEAERHINNEHRRCYYTEKTDPGGGKDAGKNLARNETDLQQTSL